MDPAGEDRELAKLPPEPEPTGLAHYVLFLPLQLIVGFVSQAVGTLRPLAGPFIPLLVCVLLVPFAGLLSLSAGWSIWRSAAVGWHSTLDLQYGDGGPPFAEVVLPTLVTQQPYDISLHLLIPAIESNFALGNFMTSLNLTSTTGKTLATVRRPAIAARPPSRLLSRSSSVLNLHITLLTAFVSETANVKALVELGRRDGWRSLGQGEGRELAVMEASVHGVVHHKGVRGIFTRFPLLTAAVSTTAFFTISLLFLAACVLPTIQLPKLRNAFPPEDEIKTETTDLQPLEPLRFPTTSRDRESDSGYSEDDQRSRRPRSSRTSGMLASRRTSRDIKLEEDIPSSRSPSDAEFVPVRRRRSQRSSDSDI